MPLHISAVHYRTINARAQHRDLSISALYWQYASHADTNAAGHRFFNRTLMNYISSFG
jgi:hypothetical protein